MTGATLTPPACKTLPPGDEAGEASLHKALVERVDACISDAARAVQEHDWQAAAEANQALHRVLLEVEKLAGAHAAGQWSAQDLYPLLACLQAASAGHRRLIATLDAQKSDTLEQLRGVRAGHRLMAGFPEPMAQPPR